MKTLKEIKVKGTQKQLEEVAKELENKEVQTIKIFGDPFVIEE